MLQSSRMVEPTEVDTDARRARTRSDAIALGLVLLLATLVFGQVVGFGFVNWDDRDLVLHNPLIVRPGSVPLLHHLTTPESGYPIPLTLLTYRLEHGLVGFAHPWLQHLVNLLFHLGSIGLVFSLARAQGCSTAGAALASSFFGLHPAAAEPVAWVTGRKDVLALFFMLLTLRLALLESERRTRLARAATFLLALGAKPVAVALVPMLVLLAFARRASGRPGGSRLVGAVRENAFEIGLALAFLPVAYVSHRQFGGLRDGEEVGASLRSAWFGLGVHLRIVLGLEPPSVRHLVAMPPPFSARFDLLPLAVAAAILALRRWLRPPARQAAGLACVWALLAYVPSSGIVPMRRFIADSYVYPALTGVGIALGLATTDVLDRSSERWRLVRIIAIPVVALGLAAMALPSAARFRSTSDLWADAMEHNPSSWILCRNWAVALVEIGGPDRSLAATDTCIERFGAAHFEQNRAVALFELGRVDEAVTWMRKALERPGEEHNVPPELLRRARAASAPVP